MNEKSNTFLETEPIGALMRKYAVPCIISLLVAALYNIVDQIFIANASYLGSYGNAANTVVFPLTVVALAIAVMIGDGCCAFVSISLGANKKEDAHKGIGSAVLLCVISSLVLTAVYLIFQEQILTVFGGRVNEETFYHAKEYFFWITLGVPFYMFGQAMNPIIRSDGSPKFAMVSTLAGAVTNIILDPIFIMPWGLGMGAAGAGCATFLSNCVACLYFFVLLYVKRGNTFVCINPRKFRIKKEIVMEVCGVGIPASIQNLLNVTGMTILNNFTSAYGADAVAAMGISYKIYMVPMQVSMGFSQGIMPLVSYNFASGDRKRMKASILFAIKLVVPALAVVTLLYYIGSGELISLFMKNESIIAYGSRFLRGFSLGLAFLSLDFLTVGVFQSLGFGKYALLFAVMRKLVLEIPALLILNAIFPLYGLAYAQFTAELILGVCAILMLRYIFRKYGNNIKTTTDPF